MMRLTEEQKMILNCYEGGKTKVIREMHRSREELKSTGEDPEMLELLENLMEQLEICTNKEFFQMKKEHLLDSEEEESETPAEM
ncbi:MAG: hypothetical protein Q4F24_04405 [Eubacteriales bacterium]|nr:hypothetical protein [Eubacteriales bacterium]